MWKDGLAFARRYASGKNLMYSRRGGSGSRRMPVGRADGRPNGVDLYGRRLAFGWEYPGPYDGAASDLRLDDVVTGKARRVDRIRGGGLTTISLTAPAFEAGQLYYARLCQGDESGCPHRSGLLRYRYSTGESARADIFRYDLWQARGAGVTYVLHDDERLALLLQHRHRRLPGDMHDPGDDTAIRLIREGLRERAEPGEGAGHAALHEVRDAVPGRPETGAGRAGAGGVPGAARSTRC